MKTFVFLCFICIGPLLAAASFPEGVEVRPNGTFRFGPAEFEIQLFNENWKAWSSSRWTLVKTRSGSDGLDLAAELAAPGAPGSATETLTPLDDNSFRLDSRVTFRNPVEIKALHGLITLPANCGAELLVNGKTRIVPGNIRQSENIAVFTGKAKQVEILFADGNSLLVRGECQLRIQDERKFGIPTFSIRFSFQPGSGMMKEATGKFTFTVAPPQSTTVDLSGAVNRGFADEPEGKRGWTGQGADNDLRALPAGKLQAGNLTFDINPAGAVVVAGEKFNNFDSSRTLSLPAKQAGAVNLLHASAWVPPAGKPVGELEIRYADHSSERIPVLAGRDCGNWWTPCHLPNGNVAWKGKNPQSFVGLYASSFPLKKRNPVQLRFHAVPNAMWMIAAVTMTDRPVRVASATRISAVEDGEWIKLDFKRKLIPGGPLDFSHDLDAPAGKHGFVTAAPDGTFRFENAPEKRVRFFGPNLVFSACFPSRETAEKLVDSLAYMGYNAVRFHHIDQELLAKDAPDSLTFDPVKLDRLDYLFAKLKERGIYITFDLFSTRTLRPGDNVPEYDPKTGAAGFKQLLEFSPAAMENYKEYVRRLLRHRNPYTGLAWGEDPAIYTIVLVNENVNLNLLNENPRMTKVYVQKFDEYRRRNNLPAGSAEQSNPVFHEFLQKSQLASTERQIRFFKEELGLRIPLTGLNHIYPYTALNRIRGRFDLVDMHVYWDHPQFPERAFNLPMRFYQASSIQDMAGVPGIAMPVRIPGKPCIATEYNFCRPNVFRAEAGPLTGALAAFQNWSGLNRFAWASRIERIERVEYGFSWDAVNDPLDQFSERITRMLFLRGDVAPAKRTVVYPIVKKPFGKRDISLFPNNFRHLGLITGIGSAPEEMPLPPNASFQMDAETKNAWREACRTGKAISSSGEIRLDAGKRTFAVNTPKSVTATLDRGTLTVGILTVRNADTFQTVAAHSLDGKPLNVSDSILLFHLTDVTNTGMTTSGDKTMLHSWGKPPMLLRRGSAAVELHCDAPRNVTALNADGEVMGTVKADYRDGVLLFRADTAMFPGGIMAYHLTR